MASPVVAGTNGGVSGGTVQNHVINLPASIASGDLLEAVVVFNPTPGDPTPGWPGGWTQIFIVHLIGGAYDVVMECRSRVADGSEGASITVTTAAFTASAHDTYRITGHDSATVPVSATATDQSGTLDPNPPSLTPAGGSKDFLFIAACGFTRNRTITVFPTNYTGGFQNLNTVADIAGVGSAVRALTAASDDPDAFQFGANAGWIAATIAVYPAGAAASAAAARAATSMHPGKSPGTTMSGRMVQTTGGVFIPPPDPIVGQPQIRSNHPGMSPGQITGRFVQTRGGIQVIAQPDPGPPGVAVSVNLRHPGRGPGTGAMSGRFATSAAVGTADTSQGLGGPYQDQIVKVRGVFPEMW